MAGMEQGMANEALGRRVSVEEAQAIVLGAVGLLDVETVGLVDSVGRVAATDLRSDIDIAPFANAAMDGFAVRAQQIANASEQSPVPLEVVAEVPAGTVYDGPIGPGQCVRIMTGAPLPAAADAVVQYEVVENGGARVGERAVFVQPTTERKNVREAGEDISAGAVAIAAGQEIRAGGVGFLASCGITQVPVFRRPRVAVVPLGSELVGPQALPGPGQIRDGNSFTLAACALQAGAVPVTLPIVSDDEEAVVEALRSAVAQADFVLTSGGASNGDYDFIKQAIEREGRLLMDEVDMKPGKAQAFGIVDGTPVLGLPGNPAAAFCGFEVLVRPALRKMQGYAQLFRPVVRATLDSSRKKKDTRRMFLRARVERDCDGVLHALPAKNQSSGLFGAMQEGSCLAVIPEGKFAGGRTPEGLEVECILLDAKEGLVF